jgi:A/G-specific adenine glycosylase
MSAFADALLAWFDRHGRHDLPWQHPRTPYRVWLSEVMLQQTQVAVVIPYFARFTDALPSLPALAAADEDQVLGLWAGLGYYSRARNLHAAARACVERHGGELPRERAALEALPGIGRSTAAAILAQAHDAPEAILDGNVKRVLARVHGVAGWPGAPAVEKRLWALSEAALPAARLADYTQAIMDFGATLCTRAQPSCAICPLNAGCVALREGRTGELPTPKPAKAAPTRQTRMLWVEDADGRVLLERRAGAGVWKGLWSLPEAAVDADPARLADALPEAVLDGEPATLPAFEHVFSHYRLRVQPLRWRGARAATLPPRVAEAEPGAAADTAAASPRRWFAPDALPALGLPAPVRTLLGVPRP